MSSRIGRDGFERPKKRTRPDRIIEKRQKWQDYLDPEEDPGLMEDDDDLILDENGNDDMGVEEEDREE